MVAETRGMDPGRPVVPKFWTPALSYRVRVHVWRPKNHNSLRMPATACLMPEQNAALKHIHIGRSIRRHLTDIDIPGGMASLRHRCHLLPKATETRLASVIVN